MAGVAADLSTAESDGRAAGKGEERRVAGECDLAWICGAGGSVGVFVEGVGRVFVVVVVGIRWVLIGRDMGIGNGFIIRKNDQLFVSACFVMGIIFLDGHGLNE